MRVVEVWKARFDCDFETAVRLVRDFSERLRDRRIGPAAFGFDGDCLRLEEKTCTYDAVFALELDLRVQGRHIRDNLGELWIRGDRRRGTPLGLRCPLTDELRRIDHTVKIAQCLASEALAHDVAVDIQPMPTDSSRDCIASVGIRQLIAPLSELCRELTPLGYWIEVPGQMREDGSRLSCFVLETDGTSPDLGAWRTGWDRNEAGIVYFLQIGSVTRLTFYGPSSIEGRRRFWAYVNVLKQRLGQFGVLRDSKTENSVELFVEDIDSFNRVQEVRPEEVKDLLPLNLLEDEVQTFFEEIMGENFHSRDWGGELNDLVSSHVRIGGRRVRAAFLLKGRGIKGRLTIAKCGQNGDQIVRLLEAPVDLYVIQHVGEIDQRVIYDLQSKVQLRVRTGHKCKMCVLDGTDTARILKAYGKI